MGHVCRVRGADTSGDTPVQGARRVEGGSLLEEAPSTYLLLTADLLPTACYAHLLPHLGDFRREGLVEVGVVLPPLVDHVGVALKHAQGDVVEERPYDLGAEHLGAFGLRGGRRGQCVCMACACARARCAHGVHTACTRRAHGVHTAGVLGLLGVEEDRHAVLGIEHISRVVDL